MAKKANSEKSSKVSIRQRKFLAEKLKGKSSSQAARDAGYAETTARKADAKLTQNPNLQKKINDLMGQAGITDELLAQRLREGLDAMETRFFPQLADEADDIPFVEVVDFWMRHMYLQTILKILGYLRDQVHVSGRSGSVELWAASFNPVVVPAGERRWDSAVGMWVAIETDKSARLRES